MKKLMAIMLALVLALSATAMAATVIDSFDEVGTWTGNGTPAADAADAKQGKGALAIACNGLAQIQNTYETPLDLSAYADKGEVKFWFFVDSAANLDGDGNFELCNGGVPDAHETGWSLPNELFKDGWNEITLKMADAKEHNCDLSKVDFIRFYKFAKGDVNVKFDALAIANPGETIEWPAEDKPAPEKPSTGDNGMVFFAVSAVVFAAAGAALLLKKRENA